jgi:peptidoglycan L-alanyl-D-glutamate endopeptidase CwlK
MASRKIEDLTIPLQFLYKEFNIRMAKAGIPFVVTCTARTVKEQQALYAQGRDTLKNVNALRKMAGLPPITDKENKYKVTWTLNSKHLIDLDDGNTDNDKARAFDIVITDKGKANWDVKVNVNKNAIPDYEEAGKIAESIGLKWGGRWKTPDYPHFEMA